MASESDSAITQNSVLQQDTGSCLNDSFKKETGETLFFYSDKLYSLPVDMKDTVLM